MIIRIEGMSCDHCVKAVKKALESIPGLKNIKVEVNKAVLDVPAGFDREIIKKAIEDESYTVASME